MYSLPVHSISDWDEFVRGFLKKYFPIYKTVQLRSEIDLFLQLGGESFWEYFGRFNELLARSPNHGFEMWRLCQIVYEGLDNGTRFVLESMCLGSFREECL